MKREYREIVIESKLTDEETKSEKKGPEDSQTNGREILELVTLDTRESRRIHGIVVGNLSGPRRFRRSAGRLCG